MPRSTRPRTRSSARLLLLALPVLLAAGVLPAGQAVAGARPSTSTSWFTDPLTPAQRATLLPVPEHPRSVHGTVRLTEAAYRTHGGGLAVSATRAAGHQLTRGQAVLLAGRGTFLPDSSRATAATRQRLGVLASSLSHVTAVRCEGYSDYTGDRARQGRLARKRAARVCDLLTAARPGLGTTSYGFGTTRPVLVGGTRSQRAANRRVIVVATDGTSPSSPLRHTVPGAPSLSVTGQGRAVTLVIGAPSRDGGTPVTGYEWSTDRTTWTPVTTSGSSPFSVVVGSLPVGTATYYVRAVNAIGDGPSSAGVAATVLDVPTAPDSLAGMVMCDGTSYFDSQVNVNVPTGHNGVTPTGVEFSLDNGQTWHVDTGQQLLSGYQWRFTVAGTDVCATRPTSLLARFTSANGPSDSVPVSLYYDI